MVWLENEEYQDESALPFVYPSLKSTEDWSHQVSEVLVEVFSLVETILDSNLDEDDLDANLDSVPVVSMRMRINSCVNSCVCRPF